MSESGSGAISNGIWKWLAALLAATMLGGLPGYINLYLNSPTRAEVAVIRDRQDIVLQRLAAIDIRLAKLEESNMDLQEQIDELRLLVLRGGAR